MCVRGFFTSISKYYRKKSKQNFSTKLQKLRPNAGRQYMSCNSFINIILLTDPVVRGISHLISNHIPLISWLEKPVSCLWFTHRWHRSLEKQHQTIIVSPVTPDRGNLGRCVKLHAYPAILDRMSLSIQSFSVVLLNCDNCDYVTLLNAKCVIGCM